MSREDFQTTGLCIFVLLGFACIAIFSNWQAVGFIILSTVIGLVTIEIVLWLLGRIYEWLNK